MEYPKRKHVRLRDYNYGQSGAYFVTICTRDRRGVLSEVTPPVGPDAPIGPQVRLTETGRVVERYIKSTQTAYPTVKIAHYVIMPNHVHLLVCLSGDGPMGASGPTLPRIIKALKGLTTRETGQKIWQRGYYEHIVRTEQDYLEIWTYIDQNPARWARDEYFTAQAAGGST